MEQLLFPIAITNSMRQIQFVSVTVSLSVCMHSHGRISWSIFHQKWHRGNNPQT